MQIKVIGLNHKTSSVEIREKLHFSKSFLPEALKKLRQSAKIKEAAVLSTCNRVEIYFTSSCPREDAERVKNFFSSFHNVERSVFEFSLYEYSEPESVSHLFKVASGIDSLVIGESQILSQVKQAYKIASETKTSAKILNRLFQTAFEVAKLVRAKTGINQGVISIGSVAVELMEKALGKISSRKVMVLGAGEVSTLVIKHLISKGISSIIVSNRSFERARKLAQVYEGEVIRFDQYLEYIPQIDIVISSTSAPHLLIKKGDILLAMEKRKSKALFLIDLAIPRDIEPDIKDIPGVFLYNIDHLKQ
ncbi:glutamyl-tRNA reductase, partial [Candidatus Aerophobetes bacterium]|nr:glutamyl-tRNA reductase [Candidatus Aerophobetes bacterium]